MALLVQTNLSSLTAQRNLRLSTNKGDETTKVLASGLRINSAADDPANLQISHKFTSQINCLNRGNQNSSEGQALVELAEGALAEDYSILSRIRQLAIQSANGIYTQEDRDVMQNEVNELCQEITRVACKTTYGGAQVLNGKNNGLIGDSGKLDFQVGSNANTTISVDLSVSFTMSSLNAEVGGVTDGIGYDAANKTFDLSTASKAQNVLEYIDEYMGFVDSKRAEMGAVSNRLNSTITNQESMTENESDARARIRDADYATETAAYIQTNTLQNATSQMLVQANARPNLVKNLLA
ncbi:MAG: flagellin [Succinivibrio sp.]|nr:flagellin [Succinivibrio sp.]MCI6450027.1 flagellin [Succinivibrio sp.]MEE0890568.1 flagellin [Succinivibrio sp.]